VPLEQRLRLLGVRASGLTLNGALQESTESAQGELPLDLPATADKGHIEPGAGPPDQDE
jgi:hypothetical protein